MSGAPPARWRPRLGIRGLLLAVNAFALSVPIAAIVLLRIFDDQLIRRTEAQLIGESVLIAEAWREAWLREQQIDPKREPASFAQRAEGERSSSGKRSAQRAEGERSPSASFAQRAEGERSPSGWMPSEAADQRYFPIEPILRLDQGVLPPTPETDPAEPAAEREGPAWRAGRTVEPVLRRAVRMNLSSARVLDAQGCVVASSGGQRGVCLGELAEVRQALAGHYAAVLRHRISDEPTPRVESISRRGRVRVYTALPVLADGSVIGVVRMSRTAIDPGKALWFDRYRLLAVLFGCSLLTAGLSLFLSRTLSQPLRAITHGAREVARGRARPRVELPALAPEELRQVSRALDQMISQLSDRAEYISEFATTVSHELKTPITAIRGASELLSQQWREMSDEERARFLANIDQDAARMERLVARLLHLARIQSAPEFAQEVALGPFVAGLVEAYGRPLQVTLSRPDLSLVIHPEHLSSALRNLLDNAFRHGADKPVDLEAFERAGRVVIRVRDRGPGISEGNRERIFQRFFTTERDRGGTGLGLVIARAVAKTRGGDLSFETSAEGTCFELVL